MYLFSKPNGKWIFGLTTDSECPAGIFRIEPSDDRSRVSIRYVQRDISFKYAEPVSNFLKENGESYASFAEFKAAYNGFFESEPRALTDEQIRATPLPVTGPITDAQLRAAPVPSSKVTSVEVRLIRPTDTVQYAANDAINSSVGAPVSLNLPDMALANGRGGYLMEIEATTNMLNLADGTVRLWLYKIEPTGLVGDNLPMINDDNNTTKGRHYIDLKFNALLSGSSVLIAQKSPLWNFLCDAASKDLKLRVQALTAFTPISGGYIDFTFTVTQL